MKFRFIGGEKLVGAIVVTVLTTLTIGEHQLSQAQSPIATLNPQLKVAKKPQKLS